MLPSHTAFDKSDKSLVNAELRSDAVLGAVGCSEEFLDSLDLGGIKSPAAPVFFVPVVDVFMVRTKKPMSRAAALGIVTSVQNVERIGIGAMNDKPSNTQGEQPYGVDRALRLLPLFSAA